MLALPTVLAFFGGGYGTRRYTAALAIVLAILAVVVVLAPWPLVPRGRPLAALLALAALCGLTAVSIAWAPVLGDAAHDSYRLLLYCAAFLLALCCLRPAPLRRRVPELLLAGIAVVALYSLAGRLFPGVVDATNAPGAGDRLNQPLRYWNALGVLMAIGIVLAIATASDRERPPRLRALACALAAPCGVALILTYSRASWLALGAGVVFLIALRPRRSTAVAAALALGGVGLLGGIVQAFGAVLHLEGARGAQGAVFAALTLAVAAGVAFACLRLLDGPRAEDPLPLGAGVRRALAVAAIPVAIGIGVAIAFQGERTENVKTGPGRVVTLQTNRDAIWGVALDAFADHPVAGVGSGGFQGEWLRERDERDRALDAHSLYIETLAELGLVGALILAALLAAIGTGVAAGWRRRPGDPVLVAAIAGLVAFAVHAAFDWDWEVPAVTLVALALAAAALRDPEPRLGP